VGLRYRNMQEEGLNKAYKECLRERIIKQYYIPPEVNLQSKPLAPSANANYQEEKVSLSLSLSPSTELDIFKITVSYLRAQYGDSISRSTHNLSPGWRGEWLVF